MTSKAIGATALGGKNSDSIAVATSHHRLEPDSATIRTTVPEDTATATSSAATMAAAIHGADDATVPSNPAINSIEDSAFVNPTVAEAAAASAGDLDRSIGLNSPPDSNNASKLDGGSSDSELSELDDDILAESLSHNPGRLEDDAGASASIDAASAGAALPTPAAPDAPATENAQQEADTSTGRSDDVDIGEVEPDHFSGNVPIFKPTMHQFRDFKKFMEKVDKYGMKSGIIKIIPPQEWKDSLAPLNEMVKTVKVREPIKQDIMGSNGTYRQVNILHQRTYNLPQWRQLCDQSEHQPPARRGERRTNAEKPKATSRLRAAPNSVRAEQSPGASGTTRRGRRGRGGVRGRSQQQAQAKDSMDEDTASVLSEPRLITPESHKGDEERPVDDKPCAENFLFSKAFDEKSLLEECLDGVMSSVEEDQPSIKKEADDGDEIFVSTSTAAPPRRMAFTRQASAKTQSTSARRKYGRREASAKVDEAAFADWDYHMDVSDYTPERCEELERIYWKTLTYAPPLYGADLPGTLFDESTDLWNLNKLPNLLDVLGTKVPGVNTAYLYLGMWKATFAWHLEDVDLYSINYLHFGAPKQWYSISQGDARRFEAAMKNIWPTDAKACDQFLRHKAFLISPSHLQHHYNIKVNKCVSYPGEFVVTYPYGYHSGYNLGYNCAEAVNFALESWLPMGKIAKKCECAQAQDSVWVDVYEIERKLRGISTEYEDESDEDMEDLDDLDGQDSSVVRLPTPTYGSRVIRIKVPTRKRKRNAFGQQAAGARAGEDSADIDNADLGSLGRKLKRKRLRIRSYDGAPCCLCPNDIPNADILPTDDGRKAHRMCALYLPDVYIEAVDGQDVVTNIANISLTQLELHCMHCRLRRGVCFQCSHKKCSRAYHATCAAAAGVFIEEGDVPIFADDGTEYKERVYHFTCRFQRTKRDRKLDCEALEKSERIRSAAAELRPGAICQLQFYRGDIFAGIVLENRMDEEMLLLQVIPNGDRVEVEWKWLLLPDPADFRLPKASTNALPAPTSRKEKEGLHTRKCSLPEADDVFVDGYTWKEFHTCDALSCKNDEQVAVDLFKPDQLWHYIGKLSTDCKQHYSEDPNIAVHNIKSNFLESVPRWPATMQPPQRPQMQVLAQAQILVQAQAQAAQAHVQAQVQAQAQAQIQAQIHTSAPQPFMFHPPAFQTTLSPQKTPTTPLQALQPLHTIAPGALESVPAPLFLFQDQLNESTGTSVPGEAQQTAVPTADLIAASTTALTEDAPPAPIQSPEPRRSYSVIKPPYVLHTSPSKTPTSDSLSTTTPLPAKSEKPYVYKPRKMSDSFPVPRHPARHLKMMGHNSHGYGFMVSHTPFTSGFSMPPASSGNTKFPQIQHPNLSHGYAAIPMTKPRSASTPTISATPTSIIKSSFSTPLPPNEAPEGSFEAKIPPPPPKNATIPTVTAQKYPFFQKHGNRDPSSYRSPYGRWGSASANQDNGLRAHMAMNSGNSPGEASSTTAGNSAKLHRRGTSSASNASSFGLGGGLKGLTRPSPHTNYVGAPPPPPSSVSSSPYLSASNLHFGPRPGSSVSSYASYDSLMNGAPGMSPHSPSPVDASPFIGSPGPPMGAFEFSSPSSSTASFHHPGMRPQFGASWQHSYNTQMSPFTQGDINFSPPSPMLQPAGLDSPANIVSSHHHSYSFGSGSMGGGVSPMLGGNGIDVMGSPLLLDSPMPMSPTLEPLPDPGTSQSPAEQLRQQLRSISDSSLPSSYRLRCLHQPRRRHQSRSSLNRIFTSQLLDLNPT